MDHQLLTMDSSLEDFLGDNQASMHTYTSNLTGEDGPADPQKNFHLRTKNLLVEEDTATEETDESVEIKSKKRAPGNRESVRKYRERKKARQASLENELIRLRIINQQLLKRLQGQVALEQEVARFKCLLVAFRITFPPLPWHDLYQCNLKYLDWKINMLIVSGGFQNEGFGSSGGSYLSLTANINNPSTAAKKRKGKISTKSWII
ncbi:hypothetical protein MKW94_005052 [Papaver nudicaule]|uniref:BZIP domain-containing protein n=1 Tax=Papaver nudicaule TaxID=74823 RepID=A0AA41VG13_PAPNU|nr:hypothetical protein [Papaver nudicaule]